MLILVPTVAAVVLSGLRISGSVSEAESYGRVERMAELGQGITGFVQEFTAERDRAVEYIAAGRPEALRPELEAQQRQTDSVVRQVQAAASRINGSYGTEAVRDAATVTSRISGLRALRSLVVGTKVPAFIVLEKYTESAQELVAVLDGISQNVADDTLAESSRALGALARAKEAVSRQRAVLLIGARVRQLTPQELNELSAARAQEDSELAAFRGSASLDQAQRFEDTVVGTKVDQGKDLRQRVLQAASTSGGLLPRSLGTARSANGIRAAMTDMIDKMRAVEKQLADAIKEQSDDNVSAARTDAMIDGAIVTALLLIVLLITIVMARSLVRPLRRLQSGALDVASTRLPGLVDRLRDPEAAAGGIEVKPIEIDSTDEIGQVARAFDEVHREAVRLAADEAVLRGNINAMFVNLSRRSQSLIERQLRLIEELEQSERDEEQLGNLFRLDHLATRMRRNCENLLVLGGQEQVRRWNQAVPLIDVVRASLSEVEQYERVALRVQGEMTVAGPVVNDLVHLLAELVENATVFSSEHTKVTVSGQMLSGGGAMLQITDNGVGMSAEDLEQANWRLANPPVIDFSAARRMGLFVVGRLAVRHGIRVELRAAQGGGLTAFVVLPDAVITPGESGGIGTRPGLAPREAGSHGQLAALTTAAEPPRAGSGRTTTAPPPPAGRQRRPPDGRRHRPAPAGPRRHRAAARPRRHRPAARPRRDRADPGRRPGRARPLRHRFPPGGAAAHRAAPAPGTGGSRWTTRTRRGSGSSRAGRASCPCASRARTCRAVRPTAAPPTASSSRATSAGRTPRAATAPTAPAGGPGRSRWSPRRSRWCPTPAPGRSPGRRGRWSRSATRRRPPCPLPTRRRASFRNHHPSPNRPCGPRRRPRRRSRRRRRGCPSARPSSTRCSRSGSSADQEAPPGRTR
ncbi:sensor histidine kinase [Actinomadura madurae]|uniref:sensor histidine kinase n=1 Tax=Actinomadura madurae TaxID=1993 RepID=UPI0027E22B85|nr:nitrate- and nitrite sensing domain-containing protein [Actinomadura madurae]